MRLSTSQYAEILFSLSEDTKDSARAAESFLSFVRTNRAMGRMRDILRAFDRIAAEREGRQDVLVETATEPESGFRKDIGTIVAGLFPGKTLSLRFSVRPELLGGARISSDDEMIDASVRRRLQELKSRIR